MFRFCPPTILLLVASFVGMFGGGSPAIGETPRVDSALIPIGENFRVENAVYTDDQKEPSSRSVTIFHDGVVYDSMKAPPETVVFDKTTKRFVLLNTENRTRTQLTTREVTESVSRFEDRLRSIIAKKPEPLISFLADPTFQEQFDKSAGKLTLSSSLVNYTLVLSTGQSEAVVGQYREFSDWYARLNMLLTPAALPPFARLKVNAAIADRKAIATQATLIISSAKGHRRTIRSTHKIVHQLTAADLDQVAQIRKAMTEFNPVDFEKYRKGEAK